MSWSLLAYCTMTQLTDIEVLFQGQQHLLEGYCHLAMYMCLEKSMSGRLAHWPRLPYFAQCQ
jgi:hypothetical protein